MKGLLFALALMAGMAHRLQAQPVFTVLDTVHASYQQVAAVSSSVFASLQNNSRIDLHSYSGNDLGRIIGTAFAGGPSSYFQHMEVAGNYLYLAGTTLQAINVTNPSLPLPGVEAPIDFAASLVHWNDLLYVIHENAHGSRVLIHSLTNPMRPALVDSFSLPGNGVLKVWQNKGYYLYNDASSGSRLLTYSLTNTAPYFSLDNTLPLAARTSFDYPRMDIVSDHLFAWTMDTVHRFHLMSGGMLHLRSKNVLQAVPNALVAKDSVTLFYSTRNQVRALFINNGRGETIDTVDVMSFNSFQQLARMGSNICYSDYAVTKLAGLRSTGVAGLTPSRDDRFIVYPNPATIQWTVHSKVDGALQLYNGEGRLLQSVLLVAKEQVHISATSLPAGSYYYMITAKDGIRSGGILLKQ